MNRTVQKRNKTKKINRYIRPQSEKVVLDIHHKDLGVFSNEVLLAVEVKE